MKPFLLPLSLFFLTSSLIAQTITVSPDPPSLDDQITVIYDATKGNAGLQDCNCEVYIHTGVITSESTTARDWKYVVTTWGIDNPDWKMTPVSGKPNQYSFVIGPSIREYYGLDPGEEVLQLAFVFRNAAGNIAGFEADGWDIYYTFGDAPPFSRELDSLELVRLYNATDGPNWLTDWDLNQPMDTWFGLTLNGDGLVSGLILDGNGLSGNLTDLQLSNLIFLHLSNNNIGGTLPDFSGLPNLNNLYLFGNNLTGSIPDFSNLPKLEILHLGNNSLSGPLPNFANLPQVFELTLEGNDLSGAIPDFSNLPRLIQLNLFANNFSGPVPNFSSVPNLDYFNVENNNNLDGNIPDFSNIPKLTQLWLSGNRFTGNLPDFSNLPLLSRLECANNRLTGNLPDFSNLPLLEYMNLSNNDLQGPIPDFTNLPRLISLFLSGNNFSGNIPDFSELPNVEVLFLDGNDLNGLIPDFSGLAKLIEFNGSRNDLAGPIPDFSNLSDLQSLNLGENDLTGPLPDFSNLPSLKWLDLGFNLIGDTLPNFSKLDNLELLILWNNELTYAHRLTNVPFLEFLTVQNNQLTFDDVLRNIDLINFFNQPVLYQYHDQAPIPAICDTIWAATGSNLAIRLYFDETVTDNVYEWFRNGQPYLTTKGQNRLNIYDLQAEDTGHYNWRVTNPNAPDLTLFVDNIYLQVDEINQDSLNHLRLFIPDVFGSLGDTVCFDVQAEPFDSLNSLDLSMKWNEQVLDFAGVQALNLPDLQLSDFNLTSALTDKGRLTLSWQSITNQGNGGESTSDILSLYQVCFEAIADTCRNALLEFTNDPLPLLISNTRDSCVFLDGRPGTFISSCEQTFRIPDESVYLAQIEYTDTLGWTNYIKKRENIAIEDTLLLGIRKSGREIGNVNDGAFLIEVQKDLQTIDITQQIRTVPGFGNIDRAVALNYWWYVRPNYTFVDADTTFGLNFYFEQEDVDRLEAAVGAAIDVEDIYFFKISSANDENACQNMAALITDGLQVYTNGNQASTSTWVKGSFGETSLVGTMEIEGFSCGGMMVITPIVKTNEPAEISYLSINPNPSSGHFTVNLISKEQITLDLKVFNSLGKQVFNKEIRLAAGDHRENLSLKLLPPGVYYLQLQNEKMERISRKIILLR